MKLGNRNRIMILKDDGTCIIEFRTAEGESLAISNPRTEAACSPSSSHRCLSRIRGAVICQKSFVGTSGTA
jgi:hypothetical protein